MRIKLPKNPTVHLPGTEEKVRVMVGRARRGEVLFHPGDARMDSAGKVRVPVFFSNWKLNGWRTMSEVEYRRRLTAAGRRGIMPP